jgi:electron transport complex protein RnfD
MLYPLIFIIIGTLSTFIIETVYEVIFNKDKISLKKIITSSYAYMPGLFLALILPINTPISVLIVGCFFATIIGKMLFGGFGQNVFNPALIGCLFIMSAYALTITNNGGYLNSYEVDAISSATPLSNLSTISGVGTYKEVVEPFGSLWNFFLGTKPGAIGETSALLCLLAFIYLAITKTIKWRIPLIYISTVFLMTFGIGLYNGVGLWYPLFEILSGGLMFGAVFMATDPVTSPVTTKGQIIYALCLGLLTVIFRYLTPYPEGVLTSILTMNMLVFIIDKIGFKSSFDIKKIIIPLIAIVAIIGTMTFIIADKFNVDETTTDPNFNINNVKTSGNNVIYTVSQKGYSSKIELQITISNGKITAASVISQGDSFFSKVNDAKYLDKLIAEQDNLEECDTVSGATVSSTAVKKAFINTLEDYNNGGYKNFDNDKVTEKPEETANPDFVINSKKEVAGTTVYNVNQKSFNGFMNLEITIINSIVTNINIISYNDTCVSREKANEHYNCPEYMLDGYVNEVITNNNTDTVSGATISSSAIKNSVANVLKDYRGATNEG